MRTLAVALLAMGLASFQGGPQAPENASIRKERLRAELFFLASDTMQGRGTDTAENRLAAEYIKSRFEGMGLKPAGPEGSFFQPFNLMAAALGETNHLRLTRKSGTVEFEPRRDFYPLNFSGSGRAKGGLVFHGFGITASEHGHDDYRGAGRAETIAVLLDHEPGEKDRESPFDGLTTSEHANALRKVLTAQEKGAVAVLLVADVHNHPEVTNFEDEVKSYWPEETPFRRRFTLATWAERVQIPVVQISPAVAAILIQGTGRTLEDLSRSAEKKGGVEPLLLPAAEVELSVSVRRDRVTERNVVGLVEGADARLKDEVVLVCAHYDHDGADGPRIYNGADDDGSGTVGVIAVAEAYARAAEAGVRPRRSVLFAAWNAEERGLLGAWAYAESPLIPLEKTVAVLNMDMIGRNEEVPVGGGRRFRGLEIQTAESNANAVNIMGYSRSPDLKREVELGNELIGLDLRFRYDNNESNLLRRSDHWPFLQRGIPVLFFHTGLHPDYHTVYDRPEKINYEKMEKIVRLVHQTSWSVAQGDRAPKLTARPTSPD